MNFTPKQKRCSISKCMGIGKRHRFPRDMEYQEMWLKTINQSNLLNCSQKQLDNKTICDFHFEEKFKVPGYRGLRVDAVPTLNLPDMIIVAIDSTELQSSASTALNDGDDALEKNKVNVCVDEPEAVLTEVSSNSTTDAYLTEEKKKIKKSIKELANKVDSITTQAELDLIKKCVASINNNLAALQSSKSRTEPENNGEASLTRNKIV